jgi:prophage DNA circulation protein
VSVILKRLEIFQSHYYYADKIETYMSGKLKDIRETASSAIEIIHEIGTPEVRASLDKVKDTTREVREIIEALSTPAMVKNIENLQQMAQTMQDTATRMENTVRELKETGIFDEVKKTSESARKAMDSLGGMGGDGEMKELSKETVLAVKALVEELRLAVADSRKAGVIKSANEAAKEMSALKEAVS